MAKPKISCWLYKYTSVLTLKHLGSLHLVVLSEMNLTYPLPCFTEKLLNSDKIWWKEIPACLKPPESPIALRIKFKQNLSWYDSCALPSVIHCLICFPPDTLSPKGFRNVQWVPFYISSPHSNLLFSLPGIFFLSGLANICSFFKAQLIYHFFFDLRLLFRYLFCLFLVQS